MAPRTDWAGVSTPSLKIRQCLRRSRLGHVYSRHDHGYSQNSKNLQDNLGSFRLLEEVSHTPVDGFEFVREMSLHLDGSRNIGVAAHDVRPSCQKTVQSKSTPLSVVISCHDDKNVFDGHHKGQGPDDDRKCSHKVLVRGLAGKG